MINNNWNICVFSRRRLVKNYQPKKKDEEDFEFTSWFAFRNVLKEIGDLAGQREVVAESLQSAVFNAITLLSKTLRDDRKKALSDGTNLTQNLTAQIAGLDRAKRAYEKAYRDSEKALDNYQRADADLNLSRAEVEKQRNNMTMKSQQSEDAKNEYANQLQKTNKLQQSHFEMSLPEVSCCRTHVPNYRVHFATSYNYNLHICALVFC